MDLNLDYCMEIQSHGVGLSFEHAQCKLPVSVPVQQCTAVAVVGEMSFSQTPQSLQRRQTLQGVGGLSKQH